MRERERAVKERWEMRDKVNKNKERPEYTKRRTKMRYKGNNDI